MNEFISKLYLYKTAYSPLYECYVKILEVLECPSGMLMHCSLKVDGAEKVIDFHVEELEQYCL